VLHGINFTVALFPAGTEVVKSSCFGMLCSVEW
jgi:hypothetical protein